MASVNAIDVVVEERVDPLSVADHEVPEGRPDSVNVTVNVAADPLVNAIAFETAAPLTTTLPEVGFAVYPETVPIVNGYVPFFSENTTEVVVEDFVDPARVTDQLVPDESPDSVNVTL